MLSILLSLAVCLAAPDPANFSAVPLVSAAPSGDASAPEKIKESKISKD